jgi:malonate decarboxylase alpha subunit
MSKQSPSHTRWATRRAKKHRLLPHIGSITDDVVLPIGWIVGVVRNLISAGDMGVRQITKRQQILAASAYPAFSNAASPVSPSGHL